MVIHAKVRSKSQIGTDNVVTEDVLKFRTVPATNSIVEIKFFNQKIGNYDIKQFFVRKRIFRDLTDRNLPYEYFSQHEWHLKLVIIPMEISPVYNELILFCRFNFEGCSHTDRNNYAKQRTISVLRNQQPLGEFSLVDIPNHPNDLLEIINGFYAFDKCIYKHDKKIDIVVGEHLLLDEVYSR